MFPGSQQLEGAAQAAAQMPLSMPEGEAMFNTNSISSKSLEQAGFQQLSKKVHICRRCYTVSIRVLGEASIGRIQPGIIDLVAALCSGCIVLVGVVEHHTCSM